MQEAGRSNATFNPAFVVSVPSSLCVRFGSRFTGTLTTTRRRKFAGRDTRGDQRLTFPSPDRGDGPTQGACDFVQLLDGLHSWYAARRTARVDVLRLLQGNIRSVALFADIDGCGGQQFHPFVDPATKPVAAPASKKRHRATAQVNQQRVREPKPAPVVSLHLLTL